MRETLNDNKTIVFLINLLVLVLLGALYYYLVYPKVENERSLVTSIGQLKTETRQLEGEILAYSKVDENPSNIFELRKKLPETRSVSELLLSLQEVELISDAKIRAISFNNYDGLVSESDYGYVDEKDRTGDADIDEINRVQKERQEKEGMDREEEEEVPETQIDLASLPSSLKLLSFNVQVEVQDHAHLLTFIKEIEAIERIKRIEDISFSQGGEADFEAVDADEATTVTLQVTTFYTEEEAD